MAEVELTTAERSARLAARCSEDIGANAMARAIDAVHPYGRAGALQGVPVETAITVGRRVIRDGCAAMRAAGMEVVATLAMQAATVAFISMVTGSQSLLSTGPLSAEDAKAVLDALADELALS